MHTSLRLRSVGILHMHIAVEMHRDGCQWTPGEMVCMYAPTAHPYSRYLGSGLHTAARTLSSYPKHYLEPQPEKSMLLAPLGMRH